MSFAESVPDHGFELVRFEGSVGKHRYVLLKCRVDEAIEFLHLFIDFFLGQALTFERHSTDATVDALIGDRMRGRNISDVLPRILPLVNMVFRYCRYPKTIKEGVW